MQIFGKGFKEIAVWLITLLCCIAVGFALTCGADYAMCASAVLLIMVLMCVIGGRKNK